MPTPLVAATCPTPECNLVPRDVESLVVELAVYAGQFLAAFARADQAIWGHRYRQGLVSNHPRTSIEPMAVAHGFPIRSMHACIGESSWRIAPLVQRHQQLLAHTLGEADAVILVDETGLPKQGQHSATVAPQSCGARGNSPRVRLVSSWDTPVVLATRCWMANCLCRKAGSPTRRRPCGRRSACPPT